MTGQEQADQDAIVNLIISELAKDRPPSEVARKLCEQGLIAWGEAEQLVREVKHKHANRIARRNMPFVLTFVIIGFFFGTVMMIAGGLGLYVIYGDMIDLSHVGAPRVTIGRVAIRLGLLVTGLGMFVGAIVGSVNLLKTTVVSVASQK